jgi:endonuclease I
MRIAVPVVILSNAHSRVVLRHLFPHVPTPTIEHVVPRSYYKVKTHPASRDLHNLMLLPRDLNQKRGALPFGSRRPGGGDGDDDEGGHWKRLAPHGAWRNLASGLYEPPPGHRGVVARKLLYFRHAYPALSARPPIRDEALLQEWLHEYPVTEEEYYANWVIGNLQGNVNPFVSNHRSNKQTF